jgi:hypothetical protein
MACYRCAIDCACAEKNYLFAEHKEGAEKSRGTSPAFHLPGGQIFSAIEN